MKQIIFCIALLSSSLHFLTAQQQHSISIDFSGFTTKEGVLFVGLYDSEENFLNHRFKEIAVPVNDLEVSVTLEGIPEGTYAVSAYHDVNDNGELDTRFFFIPKEPVGTSNNAKGRFGPPKFEDAKFSLNENSKLKIVMSLP